jgi:hypothetical protein
MRKLDVREIHGCDAKEGLKLVRTEALAKMAKPKPVPIVNPICWQLIENRAMLLLDV